jgi:hypothetical protein
MEFLVKALPGQCGQAKIRLPIIVLSFDRCDIRATEDSGVEEVEKERTSDVVWLLVSFVVSAGAEAEDIF